MGQLNWIMLDDFGRQFKVGLYHGDRTGHLLVYCNLKIIIIDFNVRNSKTYSFFLGDEFCELKVEKSDGKFQYSLTQNRTADTPLNAIRRNQHKRDLIKIFAIAFTFIITIILLLYLFDQQY